MKGLRPLLAAVVLVGAAACTEKLTTPADCPALCPGGQAVFRDTILDALPGLDTSYVGYASQQDAISLLVSTGTTYGETRAVVKFLRRGDSLTIKDTARTFAVDSVLLTFGLQARDTTVANAVVEVYRLPVAFDTLTPLAQVDQAMTPANLLGEIPIVSNLRTGTLRLLLTGADLAKVAFAPSDTTTLVVGLKVRAPVSHAIRIGSYLTGTEAPLFASYVTLPTPDTTIQKQLINRSAAQNATVRAPDAIVPGTELQIGGFPAARSFVRFTLPPRLRDSATIVRATLELSAVRPVFGIPGDTTRLDVRAVLADFGAKSPVATDRFAFLPMVPGDSGFSVEVVSLVQLWQGSHPLPSIMRLGVAQEGASFVTPTIFSTRAPVGRPRLRITYRLPFAFEGF